MIVFHLHLVCLYRPIDFIPSILHLVCSYRPIDFIPSIHNKWNINFILMT